MDAAIVESETEPCPLCDGSARAIERTNRHDCYYCDTCKLEFSVDVRPINVKLAVKSCTVPER